MDKQILTYMHVCAQEQPYLAVFFLTCNTSHETHPYQYLISFYPSSPTHFKLYATGNKYMDGQSFNKQTCQLKLHHTLASVSHEASTVP